MYFFFRFLAIEIYEDGKDGKDGKDLKDGKAGNSDRQNNGPVVVKASKDKKKINQKVCGTTVHLVSV